MNDSTGFLIYAALYRLTVLAVGALSIWLGFRLFSAAGSKGKTADNAGSASAEGGSFKLALTSILPGTYFALFGTVIIGIMLWKGEPPQWNEKQAVTLPGGGTVSSERLMRDIGCVNLDSVDAEWDKLRQPGMTLTDSAESLHKIACFYWNENRIGEAVAMANLAAQFGKNKANHLDLLAVLLREHGDTAKAEQAKRAADSFRKGE